MSAWQVTRQKVLSRDEILTVLADLSRKARRSPNTRQNLILFRLATCAGLRASELTGLALDNVRVDSARPHIRVPKAIAKGQKARVVPLTLDAATLADLRDWKALRVSQGAAGSDLFLVARTGNRIDRRNARKRFKAACRVLGRERVAELTIHHGRHSFVSHALHAGRSVVEVQQAAGHTSLSTTTRYAHLLADDGKIGNLFG
ncbi:MAG TPA: site-specific integrase [Pirellulales bacterium]|nr:site-specific integrase [Pirellulales bacterium]